MYCLPHAAPLRGYFLLLRAQNVTEFRIRKYLKYKQQVALPAALLMWVYDLFM